jgi:hypothetical protein
MRVTNQLHKYFITRLMFLIRFHQILKM